MTSTSVQSITRNIAAFNWAAAIERTARLLAIAIAFTYAAGFTAGVLVHQFSAALASFSQELQQEDWHKRRLSQLRSHLLTPPPLPPAPISPQPVLTAADTPPAGTKRSMRKRSRSSSNPSAPATTGDI